MLGKANICLKCVALPASYFSLVHYLTCLAFSFQRTVVFLVTVAWRVGTLLVAQSLVVAADGVCYVWHVAVAYFEGASVEDFS